MAANVYSIGSPTDEEQLYLELINRARANPQAEAIRLKNSRDPDILAAYSAFGVDLDLLVSQFSSLPTAPPLAMNLSLRTAALGHSRDMFNNQFQEHNGSDGSTVGARLARQGYDYWQAGENIFASAQSVLEGHAAFEVDWGFGPGGMQTPAGHRANLHLASYREIGIGIVNGSKAASGSGIAVGPMVVTQDLGVQQSDTPFITGVVYYDLNQNGAYDIGEGTGGVTVEVLGENWSAESAHSGGYAIPVGGDGSYPMVFSGSGLDRDLSVVTVAKRDNLKVDYVIDYVPPVITGVSAALLNLVVPYVFSEVPRATAYQLRQALEIPFKGREGAEKSKLTMTPQISGGYNPVVAGIAASGSKSFHLAHVTPDDQKLLFERTVRATTESVLRFSTRLGYATRTQIARCQVRRANSQNWKNVWSQAGTNGPGESVFTARAISLKQFAEDEIRIRFIYEASGSYFDQSAAGVGFYLDNVAVKRASEIKAIEIKDIPLAGQFTLLPIAVGTYQLQVRPIIDGREMPWGEPVFVAVESTP